LKQGINDYSLGEIQDSKFRKIRRVYNLKTLLFLTAGIAMNFIADPALGYVTIGSALSGLVFFELSY
jgi:hypothetical protein